jgi:hypothetical protein
MPSVNAVTSSATKDCAESRGAARRREQVEHAQRQPGNAKLRADRGDHQQAPVERESE